MTLQEGCQTIDVIVNGSRTAAPAGVSVFGLLEWLEIDPQRVAVELDRSIVPQSLWRDTPVADGASLEIVQFVGGG